MNRLIISIVLLLSVVDVTAQESEPKKQPFFLKGLYWVKERTLLGKDPY